MTRLLVLLVRAYRIALSPWLPRACRFHPSCSAYAEEALSRYGVRGVRLAATRVLRCHPLNDGGVDPVP
jgi:hypothetical protein